MAFAQDVVQICETFHIFSQKKEDLFHCCVSVCGRVYPRVSAQGGQKSVLAPLKSLQVVVSYPTCVLGKLQSPVKAASTLTTKSPLQTHSSQQLIGTYSIILPVKTNALIWFSYKTCAELIFKIFKGGMGAGKIAIGKSACSQA